MVKLSWLNTLHRLAKPKNVYFMQTNSGNIGWTITAKKPPLYSGFYDVGGSDYRILYYHGTLGKWYATVGGEGTMEVTKPTTWRPRNTTTAS